MTSRASRPARSSGSEGSIDPGGAKRWLTKEFGDAHEASSQEVLCKAMGFGVFVHRLDSLYDDSPAERYQFPSQYLARVQACLGDWIIYYEPRKVTDTRGYFAVARIQQVIPDPSASGMHLALIEPGSYLDFANPVPFNDTAGPVERGLLNDEGRISGRAQSAVRPLSPTDFNRIIELGLA